MVPILVTYSFLCVHTTSTYLPTYFILFTLVLKGEKTEVKA